MESDRSVSVEIWCSLSQLNISQAVSVTRRRSKAHSTYLPSFEWDVEGGCDSRVEAFQQSRLSLHERARVRISSHVDVSHTHAQEVMDTLLEGVAENALSVLQNSPGVEDEDAIPTCVLVCE